VACCDPRPEAIERWTAAYGGRGYTDMGEMLESEQLDGVLLATWPNLHRMQVERVLGAGVKNILCEKALAGTSSEAVDIHRMVASAGAFLMEGFMYRHSPVIRLMDHLVFEGDAGAVDSVRACFSSFDPEAQDPSDTSRDWRQDVARGG